MSRFANNALLGGGVRVRVWIREQRKIKRRSKALLLSLCWQYWTSLEKYKLIFGASLSEPHTSVTSLRTRVCIYLCLFACLLGPTTYQKF